MTGTPIFDELSERHSFSSSPAGQPRRVLIGIDPGMPFSERLADLFVSVVPNSDHVDHSIVAVDITRWSRAMAAVSFPSGEAWHAGDREHEYIPYPGTERAEVGPVVCKHCGLPAEGDISWPCAVTEGSTAWVACRKQFAVVLHDFVYYPGSWKRADHDTRANYLLDAAEILQAQTHLLPLPAQELIERYS